MALMDAAVWGGKVYTDGWTIGDEGTQDVINPATGATIGTIGIISAAGVEPVAARAARAQVDWSRESPAQRADVLRRAAQLWIAYADEIVSWVMRESGSVKAKAVIEAKTASTECYEAAALTSHPVGDVLATNENRWSFARRRPAGVVSVIAPFNFPLVLAMRSVAPALALGNSVILKPDPRTSVCGGVTIVRIFEEAGLPPGVLQLINGGPAIGEAVVKAPEVRVVSFTGSTTAGQRVGELGARYFKRVHLELGGNNALSVLPGADMAAAASAGAFGSFMHQGQICMSTGRHLVHEGVYDEYVDALTERAARLTVGDPTSGDFALGPIIDAHQLEHIRSIVEDTVTAGARIAAGGTYEGLFYQPTVLADVTPRMPAWQKEIFGPVAPIARFSSSDEAVALASDSRYGLSLGILGDVGEAMRLADRIPSGIVHINEQTSGSESHVPFGGVGDSGNGARFGGASANIEAFTETQWVTARPDIKPYPM